MGRVLLEGLPGPRVLLSQMFLLKDPELPELRKHRVDRPWWWSEGLGACP